jgi:trigger factor
MEVVLPAEQINEQVNQRLAEIRRTVKMDGFRPGKVPLSIVKKRYGPQVRQEILGDAVYKAFYDAAAQEDLKVAGYPRFEKLEDEGDTIRFTAKFDVLPEIELPELGSLEVEKVEGEITDADVDAMIDKLRDQKKRWRPANGNKKAAEGNQVIIDFEGFVDGEAFEGGKAENVPLVLGSGRMIPGFEEGILGMKKGEEKTITVKFPEEYHAESLAGKDAEFKIKVHSVQVEEKPEVDEAFVKEFGVESGDVEEFRKEIRENMARELKRLVTAQNRNAVLAALDKAVEIELPKSLVDQEIQTMMQNQLRELQMQGVDPGQVQLNAEDFRERAEQRIRLGLIIGQLIKDLGIEVTPEEIEAYIREQASAYEDPEEVVQWYKQNPEHLREIEAILVENKVADAVLDKAKTTAVKKTFEALTAQG